MTTIFTIRKPNRSHFPIENAWIIISAKRSDFSHSALGATVYSHIGKYRLITADTFSSPEIPTKATANQSIEEGLLLTLGSGMTTFLNHKGYDEREHGDHSQLNFNLNIYSSSESFLVALKEWISTSQEEIDGNVPGYFAKYELNLLRKCVSVSGLYADKSELTQIGRSENPRETINSLV